MRDTQVLSPRSPVSAATWEATGREKGAPNIFGWLVFSAELPPPPKKNKHTKKHKQLQGGSKRETKRDFEAIFGVQPLQKYTQVKETVKMDGEAGMKVGKPTRHGGRKSQVWPCHLDVPATVNPRSPNLGSHEIRSELELALDLCTLPRETEGWHQHTLV